MYPYAEQFLAYRADDAVRKVAGLVLEVKGDFCHQVRGMLTASRPRRRLRRGRPRLARGATTRSTTTSTPTRSPTASRRLLTNLYGRGKEPFWQQAYTNLVKFVILLHKTLDDYVTLFQVYEPVINPDKLRAAIAEGDSAIRRRPPRGRRRQA